MTYVSAVLLKLRTSLALQSLEEIFIGIQSSFYSSIVFKEHKSREGNLTVGLRIHFVTISFPTKTT